MTQLRRLSWEGDGMLMIHKVSTGKAWQIVIVLTSPMLKHLPLETVSKLERVGPASDQVRSHVGGSPMLDVLVNDILNVEKV